MAIMRVKEIVGMSPADRTKKLEELRAELSRMRTMVRAGGSVENPTRIHELRKTIAQILTVENQEKKKAAETPAAKKTEKKPEAAAEQKIESKPKAKKGNTNQ
jgi:large subunit ribosomal protein L29